MKSDCNPHLLIVEDDTNLSLVIKDYLVLSGFNVTLCDNGKTGWETFQTAPFDLCILDIMLPEFDGFTLAEKIRKQNTAVPILFLTAKGDKDDKIKGFKLGADDYIVKPFNIEELVLRIEVFLKRSRQAVSPKQIFALGNYTFDYLNLCLRSTDKSHKLTQREADVLRLLCQNEGKITKREDLLVQIWGEDDYFLGRSLDVFISKLRRYMKHDSSVTIVNHHGVGFQLNVNHS